MVIIVGFLGILSDTLLILSEEKLMYLSGRLC